MTKDRAKQPMRPAVRDGKQTPPELAEGLRELYDAVLNEPLPDSFLDLLAQLDEGGT